MDSEEQITDLAYTAQGLAHVLLHAIDSMTPDSKPDEEIHYLYTQALVLSEKLDELAGILDSEV